ncbi:MAG: hypothetical protein AB1432_01175 [Bacteroidota bacterium]|jgi:hypothetical protein
MVNFCLTIFLFVSSLTFSQQIYFCKGYTESGEPIDPFIGNKIEVNQSFTVLLKLREKDFDNNLIFISIKKSESRFDQNNVSKMLRVVKGKNWITFNHKITEEGNYTVSFRDFNKKEIASSVLAVEKPKSKKVESFQTGYFMPNLKIIFCKRIVNGSPAGILEKISLFKSNGEVYIYLINNMPLRSSKLLVNIWKKTTHYSGYEEFIDTKKYEINSEWYDTFFKYRFEKAGEYKINFFNQKELLLKSAYITVEN